MLTGVYGELEERLIYGVFNTPPNSIGGSAVCAFRIKDITAAFAGQVIYNTAQHCTALPCTGLHYRALACTALLCCVQFKEQRNTGDNWLAVEPHRVPEPRPGNATCKLYDKKVSHKIYFNCSLNLPPIALYLLC